MYTSRQNFALVATTIEQRNNLTSDTNKWVLDAVLQSNDYVYLLKYKALSLFGDVYLYCVGIITVDGSIVDLWYLWHNVASLYYAKFKDNRRNSRYYQYFKNAYLSFGVNKTIAVNNSNGSFKKQSDDVQAL